MKRLVKILSLVAILAFTGVGQAQTTNPYAVPQWQDQFDSPNRQYPDERRYNGYDSFDRGAEFEAVYRSIWNQIRIMYYKPEQLKDWGAWEHKFDGKLNSADELDLAIQQMTESLDDQWTKYVTRMELIQNSQEQRAGHLPLGIQLKKADNGTFYIDFIVWGSPAHRSSLRRGDVVTEIAGTNLNGLTTKQANQLLKGDIDTTISITYLMNGKSELAQLAVRPTPEERVTAQVTENDILYIRLPDFDSQERTAELINAVRGIGQKMQGRSVKGIIFDLRGNGGGSFPEGLNIASLFLKEGVIVSSKTRNGRIFSNQTYEVIPPLPVSGEEASAKGKEYFNSILEAPMVVLVDENSASASEVVTGALKDNKRATVMGKTTYGKGVGYATSTGPTGGVITITALEYLTPSGYNLARKGIKPDVEVDHPRGEQNDVQLLKAIEFLSNNSK